MPATQSGHSDSPELSEPSPHVRGVVPTVNPEPSISMDAADGTRISSSAAIVPASFGASSSAAEITTVIFASSGGKLNADQEQSKGAYGTRASSSAAKIPTAIYASSGGKSKLGKKNTNKVNVEDVDGTGVFSSNAEVPTVIFASSSGKPKSGQKDAGQKNSRHSYVNKFSPLEQEETCEMPKESGYPRRETTLAAKAVELEEQNKKKSLSSEYQTVCSSSLTSHK